MTEHEPGLLEDWDHEDWGHKDCDVCNDARRDRLTAAQEGVVKALEGFWDFLGEGAVLLERGGEIDGRWPMELWLDARAALDELKEAQK